MWKRFLAWLNAEDVVIPPLPEPTLADRAALARGLADNAVTVFNRAVKDLEVASSRLDEIANAAFQEAEALANQAREAVEAAKANARTASKIKELLG